MTPPAAYLHPTIGAALATVGDRPDGLTDREIDVLRLLVEGDTNAEVAAKPECGYG